MDDKNNYIHPLEMLKSIANFFTLHWLKAFFIGLIGGIIGFVYAFFQPITYTATNTFVVQEGKSSGGGLSSIASLAGQFGVSIGGGGGTGSVLAGDNIFLYFKNEKLIRQVLLSSINDIDSRYKTLGDAYAAQYGFDQNWSKKVGYKSFDLMMETPSAKRTADSLLQILIGDINKKRFDISRVDKKADFISINCTMVDEKLAKLLCDRILNFGVDNYTKSRTQRQENTVMLLQNRYDSILTILQRKTNSSVNLQLEMQTSDINALYRGKNTAASEMYNRDKTILSAILIELTKNLELAKYTLSEETPAIQIIDSSIYPLKKNKTSKVIFAFSSAFFLLFLSLMIYIILKSIF
jgi:hypothetical protein